MQGRPMECSDSSELSLKQSVFINRLISIELKLLEREGGDESPHSKDSCELFVVSWRLAKGVT